MGLLNWIIFFEQYSFVFSFIYTTLTAIVRFVIGKLFSKFNEYKIRTCLSLSRNECKIILPSYNKTLHNRTDIIPVCPIGDIRVASNIIDLIHNLLYNYKDLYKMVKKEKHYFISFKLKTRYGNYRHQ